MLILSRILIALAFVLTGLTVGAAHTIAATNCAFVLGFADMKSLIPAQVGDCLENEHHNPTNGDTLQQTTGGLLVWRKADNWTAFTDGSRTWVNGKCGIEQRLNTRRFSWEANPDRLPVTQSRCDAPPPPTPTPPGNPWRFNYSGSKLIYDPPSAFCSYFDCIGNFWNGRGYVIQCRDLMFGKSGGIRGSCSYHGGNYRALYAP